MSDAFRVRTAARGQTACATLGGAWATTAPTSMLLMPHPALTEYAALFFSAGDNDPAYLAAWNARGKPLTVSVLVHLEPGAVIRALVAAYILDTDARNPTGPQVPRQLTATERACFVQLLERVRRDTGYGPAFTKEKVREEPAGH